MFFKVGKYSYILKIETTSKYIKGILEDIYILKELFVDRIKVKDTGRNKIDFSLYLALSKFRVKKEIKIPNKNIFRIKQNNINRKRMSTLYGSYISIDLKRRYGVGKIVKGDPYNRLLIWKSIHFIFNFLRGIRLHSAIVEKKNKAILIGGGRNAGKTTFTKLLKKYKQFNITNDDIAFFISINNKIYNLDKTVYRSELLPRISIPYLFIFIYFSPQELSRWKLLSKKESFERLVFLSEFPSNESPAQREKRLNILKKLAEQCRCYLLVNGKDLINNFPKIIKGINLSYNYKKDKS